MILLKLLCKLTILIGKIKKDGRVQNSPRFSEVRFKSFPLLLNYQRPRFFLS